MIFDEIEDCKKKQKRQNVQKCTEINKKNKMITDLFTVENGKVKPSLHCHMIPEFKQIIDKYDKRATDMLASCFLLCLPI